MKKNIVRALIVCGVSVGVAGLYFGAQRALAMRSRPADAEDDDLDVFLRSQLQEQAEDEIATDATELED